MKIGARELALILPGITARQGPIYRRIADGLGDLIRRGDLPGGMMLPSERQLAAQLRVSRTTVVAAYRQLQASGAVQRREGSGTRVAPGQPGIAVGAANPRMRLASHFLYGPAGTIDLATIDLVPLPRVAETAASISARQYRDLLHNGTGDLLGLAELRSAIAQRMTADGLATTEAEVLVTAGGQHSIELVAEGCVGPDDTVLLEVPAYRGALAAFGRVGCRIRAVASDRDGIVIPDLERALAVMRPRLLYLQSHIANPSGASLAPARRRRVHELAAAADVLVLDDRSLADTSFGPIPPPFDDSLPGRVTTIGSLNKLFWSGLRIGWIRARPDIIGRLARRAGATAASASVLSQYLCARLLDDLDGARAERRRELEQAYRFAAAQIAGRLPGWSWTEPKGGPGIWAQLPHANASEFAALAMSHGVAVLPERVFITDADDDRHVRIVFAHAENRVSAGLERLAEAWNAYSHRTPVRGYRRRSYEPRPRRWTPMRSSSRSTVAGRTADR